MGVGTLTEIADYKIYEVEKNPHTFKRKMPRPFGRGILRLAMRSLLTQLEGHTKLDR